MWKVCDGTLDRRLVDARLAGSEVSRAKTLRDQIGTSMPGLPRLTRAGGREFPFFGAGVTDALSVSAAQALLHDVEPLLLVTGRRQKRLRSRGWLPRRKIRSIRVAAKRADRTGRCGVCAVDWTCKAMAAGRRGQSSAARNFSGWSEARDVDWGAPFDLPLGARSYE
jgi:hypothetical protein